MPTDACAINRLKEFRFRLEINGYPSALCRGFNPGDRSHGVTEHAGAGQNYPCKEVGMIRYGNATLRQIVPLEGPGRIYFEQWMNLGQDANTGNGEIPAKYMKNMSLYELDPNGDPSRVWEFKRAFPVNYSLGNRDSLAEASDVIEEISIAYTKREMRTLQ